MLKKTATNLFFVFCLMAASSSFADESKGYVGSKNSKKFHYSWCKAAQKIGPKNKVEFKTAQEAQDQGREPCKVCKPSSKE